MEGSGTFCELVIIDNTRTSMTEPWLFTNRKRERVWNMCFHHHHNAVGTYRRVFDLEVVIIPWDIRETLPQVDPIKLKHNARNIVVLCLHSSNRAGYQNKVVVGGVQWREQFNRVSLRVGS